MAMRRVHLINTIKECYCYGANTYPVKAFRYIARERKCVFISDDYPRHSHRKRLILLALTYFMALGTQ